MTKTLFSLSAEIRNEIYELVFDVKYEQRPSTRNLKLWTHKPKNIALIKTCKQLNVEAGTFFYKKLFPLYEHQAFSFTDLHKFTQMIPAKYRRQCKVALRLLISNGAHVLSKIGLSLDKKWLPWQWDGEKTPYGLRDMVSSSAKLRGDCFLLTYYRAPGDMGGYDRITMIGHLGRLEWIEKPMLKIVYQPPKNGPIVAGQKVNNEGPSIPLRSASHQMDDNLDFSRGLPSGRDFFRHFVNF